jgi:hypothetical protein
MHHEEHAFRSAASSESTKGKEGRGRGESKNKELKKIIERKNNESHIPLVNNQKNTFFRRAFPSIR